MATALIVYGSTTGNTEWVAKQIGEILAREGIEVTVKNVTQTQTAQLGKYDLTLLGSSTWGDAEIEFQEDFAGFYEDMGEANLKGKKIALFGCGDYSYKHYCGAVTLLEETVGDLGALLVNEPLMIDGEPQDAKADIIAWAQEVASHA